MKKEIKIFITFSILILLIISFFLITSSITRHTGYSITNLDDKTDFEKCLEEQYIALYINTADTAQTLRQIELQDYLDYPKITNCYDYNQPCIDEQINNFPAWIINGNKLEKDISFSDLIKFSGCRFS